MLMEPNRSHPYNFEYAGQMVYGYPFVNQWDTGVQRSYPYPYPYSSLMHNDNWQLYHSQNQYLPNQYQPFNQNYIQPQQQYSTQPNMYKDSQFLFQNPLQPQEELFSNSNQYQPMNDFMNANPYPKQNFMPKPPGGMQSIMNSFKSQDGSIDFNKMVNTAGQMMTAVNQVSSLVKGLGGMFKA